VDAATFAALKQLWAIVLLLSMLGQTFSRYIVVLDYRLNKTFIAKNLCENKDRPEMKCEGKCYLCKRLKKEDKKDQDNPERKGENKFELISIEQGYLMTHPFRTVRLVEYPYFQEMISNSYATSFFHPPQG